ncbi:unnamed protein product [Rhizophagus irregularis]|uniref:Protein far1-related sequence 5-like n=1 Tax=Rhizophagus irregularis TaxID=588596 RepID=A0A915Z592_9GLOM|nr:unnamed protein product [Rhizophagus irregularis]
MELDWESFINFPKDIEDVFTPPPNFFIESGVNCDIEDTIISPNDNIFIELEVEPINPVIDNTNTFNYSNNNSNFPIYQYNLHIGDMFDDWMSVDKFMYNYCLERGFGYQIYRNDKDINDHSIIRRKSFRCSLNGNYEGQKIINQNVHRLCNSNKTNCEWHCNFKLPKTEQRIRCTTLIDSHNHELNSAQIAHLNARYRQFNDDMMQDLAFFTDCKVAPILHGNNKDENLDSGLLLNVLFEKMTEDSNWKVFIRHSGNERRLSEPGLINAASHVFPTTPHFYCLFHIWQNIIKHLKNKLGEAFPSFSKAFYLCRNTLSVELFEQHWKVMMSTFPESCSYMTKVLYSNRSSWAKSYSPFQFNAGIQSTQSVESFNGIIKKAVNSTSSLCDVEKAINKRHDDESQYCKLVDLKAQQTTVGLPHLASQFFSNIDAILNHFLTPLVLSWQRFQISQSLTYEGQLVLSFDNVLESDTVDNYFIEDVVDEPQIILQSFLNGIDSINIIETWRIRRVGGLSKRENLVILLDDGSHLCTCMESVTKGIICRHFWHVMLYSGIAKFHISIIPNRWYKDSILTNLEGNVENSPILTAIESNDNSLSSSSYQINFTLQNMRQFQGLDDNKSIHQQNTSQRNRFGIAFSIAKTAVNIALETNSDCELIWLLKEFIASKRERSIEVGDDDNLEELMITDPNVTKIRGAPSKRRLKSVLELSKRRIPMREVTEINDNQTTRVQRKCLLCGQSGHYQKKCPIGRR